MNNGTPRQPTPPRMGRWLLERSCPPFLYEEVRGDLDELYRRRRASGPRWKADLLYTWEALTSVRLQALARKSPSHNYPKDHLAMIRHYARIALRNIRKHKAYNFINVGGLAVGLACCLMIALYVRHELSYDTWMADSERIYRVPMEISSEGNTRTFSVTSATVAPALESDYAQVEETLRLYPLSTRLVTTPDEAMYYEENAYFGDPSFHRFFSLPMLHGEWEGALDEPNSVVLSRSAAEKFFGSGSALGQTLNINNRDYEVTGVMADTPENTHHDFNMVLSWSTVFNAATNVETLQNWHSTMFFTYVKLRPGADAEAFAASIADLANRYVGDDLAEQKQSYRYVLQPVTDIHLNPEYAYETKPAGSATAVYIFGVIAVLVLLIACLNFVNLSTARSEIRSREVGLRKVVGARRGMLVGQFLGEALLTALLALALALVIFTLALPWYNQLVGVTFSTAVLGDPAVIASLLGVTLAVGLGAGFYPALVLSSFSPLTMFQGRGSGGTARGARLRKVLVVGQFAVSVILIAGTITVYKQINHMLDKDLGFTTEQMMVLPIRGSFNLQEQHGPVKDGFGGLASVEGVTLSSSVPGQGASNFAIRINREQNDMTQSMYHMFVEYDFTETFGLEIVAGRDFDQAYGNDLGGTFLINEAAVESFGWSSPEEAIGQELQSGAGGFTAEIVGVFRNFHYRTVDRSVDPLVLNIRNLSMNMLTLRLQEGNIAETVGQVEAQWASLFPDKPFEYFFLDDSFSQRYDSYRRTGSIVLTFSVLAILIACLGLYGLAAFSARRRTKEIGIRKVLGATVPSLTLTVSQDFLKLVAGAVVVGLAGSIWLLSVWLQQFAYRIELGPMIFLWTALIALGIALLTVSGQSIKAALTDPVESLRSE